jgi:hypothetical protein
MPGTVRALSNAMNNDTNNDLAPSTHARFMAYWDDRENWGGEPCVGGNVGGDEADKGYLLNMKKAGLISTWEEEGAVHMVKVGRRRVPRPGPPVVFVRFTAAGESYAARFGAE